MPDFDDLWNYNAPAETEQRFRALLPEAETSGDRSYYLQLLTQIARTQGLQARYAEAHATLDHVEPLLTTDLVVARIRYLLERGRAFRSAGRPEQAEPLFLQAWELGRSAEEDNHAVDAAHMLGITDSLSPEIRMEWNLRALDLAERSPAAARWLGSLYNNIGWAYADTGDYGRALALFETCVAFREQQDNPVQARIARWSVAKMLRLLKRAPEALAIQELLLEVARQQADEDGFLYEEIGECLLELNRAVEAQPYFTQAYTRLSQMRWLAESEPQRLQRLQALGSKG